MICQQQHRYSPDFSALPDDQSKFNGRHKCAGCAYEKGYERGRTKAQFLNIDYSELPDSQAGTVRHKSVQAAFAKGYFEGVLASYS
ncbi:hypothetical protein [Erwinia amylovora]|uniref:Uncharacterized protein n=1 Tax=Erwinia amylovora TaxID=552 RepID=A0ABX7MDX0_ERWAM|nr:hypothetical protein [Erwinia amylovora]CDK15774.1 hypothetical protein LA635_2150 [Erwinia amylovora LA635]CDK19140.1 hypothetical protein LA636_2148 [Erwinia amylovora LA636]CDK22511.1 hypothetical protein LA637_2151 [Erwinia amylovora LA637]ATZ12057.1 hypothetical protein AD997_11575 [Erwinia amylovora]MBZ2389707.1 hypothetical protein [Erwinia amylovora]